MLRFISFGSGSSGNCYFLYTDHDGLLIDCGVGIRTLKKHFRAYGVSLSQVHHILITHDHADHIKSVGSLSHDYHLPVYATSAVHNGIDRNYCITRKVASEYRHIIEVNHMFEIGDFKVTAFHVPHDSSDNVGYFIESEGATFCMMTDVGHVTEEMPQYISKASYLVIEANHDPEMLRHGPYPNYLKEKIVSETGHLNNIQCGEAIAQNMSERLRYVWLCHLSEDNNHPELARKTVESVLRSYGIIVGKDLQLDVLKRKMPSGVYDLI